MARKQRVTEPQTDFSKVAKVVEDIPLEQEIESSFYSYSTMVVTGRSIPDARDGMKPVHRRILWSMIERGVTPDKNHVKSARIVGDVMGTYHPHGDTAIYDSLSRLVRGHILSVPLIDPHGNFGNMPGATAAASRYTEARLSKAALPLLEELKENAVDFRPNYDSSAKEPVVLPVKYPVLTINGSSGIAVGFASEMAPHNAGEVIAATRWLLTHPNATLEKLMEFVPGPDFPTGAQIFGVDGVREAYETGRGKIILRAPYEVNNLGRGKHELVFFEMPYEVAVESVIDGVKKGIKEQKIQGVTDVKDLTGRRNGIRLVVETKAGVNPKALAEVLYKTTRLETTFNFNNIALVNGAPRLLGLKEQLEIFLEFRMETVLRRTANRKEKRAARLHLVEGLLKALANIDAVIKIVRGASDATVAQNQLMKRFKLDEVQADYILSIPLRRLTKFDQIELNNERDNLQKDIAALDQILSDDKELRNVIAKELSDMQKLLERDRRAVLVDGREAAKIQEEAKEAAKTVSVEVADEPTNVFLTRSGGLVQAVDKRPRALLSRASTTTRGKFIAVSNRGRAWRLDTLHVPQKIVEASTILPDKLAQGERLVAVTPVELSEGKAGGIAMGTSRGVVKICTPTWPIRSDDFVVFSLDDGEEILSARWVDDVDEFEFAFMTSESNMLRFAADKVRPQGLTGRGVAGIKIGDDAQVISFDVVSKEEADQAVVISVADSGRGKVTPWDSYPVKGRATGGVRTLKLLRGDTKVTFGFVGNPGTLSNDTGKVAQLPEIDPRRDGSGKEMDIPVR